MLRREGGISSVTIAVAGYASWPNRTRWTGDDAHR